MQQHYLKSKCINCSPKGYCVDKYKDILRNNGGRLTIERLALLKTICDTEGHFQPNDILMLLKKQGHNISLTTIYRNLAILVQAGIICEATVQESLRSGGVWYEHIWDHDHHDHLICSHCGKKVEFFYPAIDILQEAVVKEHGFILERHHLELIGMCPECQNKKQTSDALHNKQL
jgi:Fur family ferric uptake transcriptional regulator